MAKIFNVNGACRSDVHYMVNLTSRLNTIKKMVDAGDYFVINRARQYGKTTTLRALADFLEDEYVVISLDFQMMDEVSFANVQNFVAAFAEEMLDVGTVYPEEIREQFVAYAEKTARINSLQALFKVIKAWCGKLEKTPVLIIDEADSASNNQVFLDFLSQLRAYYLRRPDVPTFQSVILAGVHDVRSIRRKIRTEEDHKENSPWNIAAEFDVDMSFGKADIINMLEQYECDYHTGMNISEIAGMIYDETSGYPVLVSRICKLLDEKIAGTANFPDKTKAWTEAGIRESVKRVIKEDNPLYESMLGKLKTYPELKSLLQELLFNGRLIPYVITNSYIKDATMYGFIRNENDTAVISNRIFETVLYNTFISEEHIE